MRNRRDQRVYAATAGERLVSFSPSEKALLYRALMHTIPAHRSLLRIFTPLVSVYALSRQYNPAGATAAHGCRGGLDFFFVSAEDGDTYPCGYRGRENLGKFWRLDLKDRRPGPECRRCDWECFRDPSEMCAPILLASRSPRRLIRRIAADPVLYHLWLLDLRYYCACHLFDGRRPADAKRLRCFAAKPWAPPVFIPHEPDWLRL